MRGPRPRRNWQAPRSAAVLALLLTPATLLAGPGALDPSFGTNGRVLAGNPLDASALVIQPDGSLLAGGARLTRRRVDFGVARYLPDGRFDAAFGRQGMAWIKFNGGAATVRGLALQPDGHFLATGTAYRRRGSDMAMARFPPDGRPDRKFGRKGKTLVKFRQRWVEGNALALQPDGKVVVAGAVYDAGRSAFALARLLPNGRPDRDFGDRGVVVASFGFPRAEARAVALAGDGKIVLAGAVLADEPFLPFAVARFLPDGTPDPDFGDGGLALASPGSFSGALALVLQDGRPVVAGSALAAGRTTDFALLRFTEGGELDPSFGEGGLARTDFLLSETAQALAVQPDGRLVAAGTAVRRGWGGASFFAVARYLPDGAPDPDFGEGGTVLTRFGGADFDVDVSARAVGFQPDGGIVVAGRSAFFGFALARYQGN